MKGVFWIVTSIKVSNTYLQRFLSSSVISFSRSRFNKCAKSRSSFCLMISTNSYILKSSFHKFRAREDAPFSKSRHINLSPTGFNWYKSPTAITLKPPKTAFVPFSCCKRVSIKLSIRLPTIDISSMIITFRCLYFILNVFSSSADRRFVPWYIFLWKAEQMV